MIPNIDPLRMSQGNPAQEDDSNALSQSARTKKWAIVTAQKTILDTFSKNDSTKDSKEFYVAKGTYYHEKYELAKDDVLTQRRTISNQEAQISQQEAQISQLKLEVATLKAMSNGLLKREETLKIAAEEQTKKIQKLEYDLALAEKESEIKGRVEVKLQRENTSFLNQLKDVRYQNKKLGEHKEYLSQQLSAARKRKEPEPSADVEALKKENEELKQQLKKFKSASESLQMILDNDDVNT